MRPLRSVFLRCVLRLSVSGNTVLRVQLPRPLVADDDLPAPSSIADPSPKTHCLTSGRVVCYKVVWSCPGALAAWCHDARPAVAERGAGATRRRRGEKGFIFPIRKRALFFRLGGMVLRRAARGRRAGGWGDAAARGEKRALFFLSVPPSVLSQDTPQLSRGQLSDRPCIDARLIKHSPLRMEGFAVACPLAPRVRSMRPSDPDSRRRPGASLVLRIHAHLDRGLAPPSMTACPAHTPRRSAAARLLAPSAAPPS